MADAASKPPRPRVYLAGPEVFLPNAREVGNLKRQICATAGLEGLFPLDADLDLNGLHPHVAARAIALGNEGLMRSADTIIANLTPFRGVSMDAGTAFEVGFMRALRRPVFGYTNAGGDYRTRALSFQEASRHSFDCDRAEFEVEDFSLPENLMIAIAIRETPAEISYAAAPDDGAMAHLAAFTFCVEQVRRHFELPPRT